MIAEDRSAVREPGILEHWHIARHALGLDTCIQVAATYSYQNSDASNSHERELSKPLVFLAVRKTIASHRALSVRLKGDSDSAPTFSRLSNIDLTRIVSFRDDDESLNLTKALEEGFLKGFDTDSDSLPLWRLMVIKGKTVIFAYHHAIGDGLSGAAFHRSFQSSLNAIQNADKNSFTSIDWSSLPVPESTTFPFIPSIDASIALPISTRKWFTEIYNIFAPTSWTTAATAWSGNKVLTPRSVVANRVRLIELSQAEVKNIMALCKSHGATLTALIHTLAVSVLSTQVLADRPGNNGEFRRVCTTIPMSLREVAGTSPDALCDHVTAYASSYSLSDYHVVSASDPHTKSRLWHYASQLSETLRSSRLTCREEIGMIKYLFGNYRGYFLGKLGKPRQTALEVSNLGRVQDSADDTRSSSVPRWTFARVTFAQYDAVVGATVKVNVAGDRQGSVAISVTWGEGAVDDAFAEAFVVGLQDRFHNIVQSGATGP